MAVAGSTDVAIELFGGLVTDMAPADLPAGVSPDCQDVKFVSGSVQTRPGLQSIFGAIAGTPKVNYLKTYVTPTGLLRLLALDAAGSLWKESSVGDRKSTRLNSSHSQISYAVFCLKKNIVARITVTAGCR